VKTGVRSVRKALKTLDSGFRRNDVEKNQIDFLTPSGLDMSLSATRYDIENGEEFLYPKMIMRLSPIPHNIRMAPKFRNVKTGKNRMGISTRDEKP